MPEIALKDFVKSHTHAEAAKVLDCAPSNIHKLLKRDVRMVFKPNGDFDHAYKISPVPDPARQPDKHSGINHAD